MDKSSMIGTLIGLACIVGSILISASIGQYVDIASILVVIGGSIAAALISTPMPKFTKGLKAAKFAFSDSEHSAEDIIKEINELALVARKEGMLALEGAAQNMDNKFLKKGVMLMVDGTEPELVRGILETELTFIESRHEENQAFWGTIAEMGPAWGMVGTLIGLIAMLGALDDPTTIGPKMGVALITTLYGSVVANFMATPIANKLKIKTQEEILIKQLMLEGILSIQAGDNPRVIEEKLKAFLSPELREFGGESEQ